jgi:hypothetical protein
MKIEITFDDNSTTTISAEMPILEPTNFREVYIVNSRNNNKQLIGTIRNTPYYEKQLAGLASRIVEECEFITNGRTYAERNSLQS